MSRISRAILIVLFSLLFHTLTWWSGVLPYFDFQVYDLLSRLSPDRLSLQSSDVVVVEIDEASLNVQGQWPWPRIILALLTSQILEQQPAVLGLDIIFPEADRTSPKNIATFYKSSLGLDLSFADIPAALQDNDQIFARVLGQGPTILPFFLSPEPKLLLSHQCNMAPYAINLPGTMSLASNIKALCSHPLLQNAASGSGFINAAIDSDGTFRREPLLIQMGDHIVPSMVLAMLKQLDPLEFSFPKYPWQGIKIHFADKIITTNRHGEMFVPRFEKDAFQRISVQKVLSGNLPNHFFTGKMVLLGASATGLFDQFITSSGSLVPGVFMHAALLESLLHGGGLYQADYSRIAGLIISFICSLGIICLVFKRNYLVAWLCFLAVCLLGFLFTIGALYQGVYLSLGFLLFPFVGLFSVISLFFAILHHIERRRFLEDLGAAHCATIDSMTMVAESRDVETGSHIVRTKEYVALLARTLAAKGYYLDQLTPHSIELMYRAAPLHDIGKVGVPDAILRKPGRLDEDELQIMKQHVEIGRAIIDNASNSYNRTNEFLTLAANICYSHHEKWDGSGYPQGLAGHDIPLEGRLMALSDVYDALVSSRCYKKALTFEQARDIIVAERGNHFEPLLIDVFLDVQDLFADIARCYEDNSEFVDGSYRSGWSVAEN